MKFGLQYPSFSNDYNNNHDTSHITSSLKNLVNHAENIALVDI
jgi:hypothetical protein